jgi:hypothetical protein
MWSILAGIVLGVGIMAGAMIGFTAVSGGSFEDAMFGILIMIGTYFAGIILCALGSAASMIKVAGDTALKSRLPPPKRDFYEPRR